MDAPLSSVETPLPSAPPVVEHISTRLREFQVADHERRGGSGGSRKRFVWLFAFLILAAAGAAGYSYRQANNIPEAEVFVFTGKPTRDVLLDLSGFIVPHTKVVISPQVNGIVSRVCIPEEGKKVRTGDTLFEVEDARYKAEYEQAEASLSTAEAQLEELRNGHEDDEKAHARALYEQAKVQERLAAIEAERARKLYPSQAIGQADFDKTVTNYHDAKAAVKVQKTSLDMIEGKTRYEKIKAAEAEVKRAKATRDRAKYYFEKTRIKAPADAEGHSRVFTVLQKHVNPGESIQADFAFTALCTLADLREMEAEIDVQERDLHQIHKGTPCEIIPDAYPDRVYRGTLDRIQPLVNRQRGVVQVKVRIDAPDEFLLPDMNARVLFLKDADKSSISRELPTIPYAALVPQNEGAAVFVLDGQRARLRTIQIGEMIDDAVQVREGLKADEKILLPLGQPLHDGKPVRLCGQGKDGSNKKDAQ